MSVCPVICTSLLRKSVWHGTPDSFEHEIVSSHDWHQKGGHAIQNRELLDGLFSPFLPLYLTNYQLGNGIPVFLWQWVPLSHENKTFFSLKWSLSLFCSSVWAFPYHKKRRHIVSYLSPCLKSITLIHYFFVIGNTIHFLFVWLLWDPGVLSILKLMSRHGNKSPSLGILFWKFRPQLYSPENLLNIL